MKCMKCGREISEMQVFCEDCLLDMEKYPIKPGTTVQLPKRTDSANAKKAHPRRRGNPSPEEQVKLLKKRICILVAALTAAVILIIALAIPAAEHLMEDNTFLPGQNYSAVTSDEPAQAE